MKINIVPSCWTSKLGFSLDVDKSITFEQLKPLISREWGIRPGLLLLNTNGHGIPDAQTLEDGGVTENGTVVVLDLAECAFCNKTQAEVGLCKLAGSDHILCSDCRSASSQEQKKLQDIVSNISNWQD